MNALLSVTNLAVDFTGSHREPVRALDGLDFKMHPGETVALVGESGSGKSTLASAVAGLLPGNARVSAAALDLDGTSLLQSGSKQRRALRRELLGYVFQNPRAALDPTMRIGRQLTLALGSRAAAVLEHHLRRVQLEDWRRIARSYPHQISGGMAQRVAIALAMLRDPALLIADEPTAALDRQVQGQVLDVVFDVTRSSDAGVLLLSHDLPVASARCERIVVMYAGRIVEDGSSAQVAGAPRHPYTAGLLASAPSRHDRGKPLAQITGSPPVLHGPSKGCAFAPRCPRATEQCRVERPEPSVVDGRTVLCHHPLPPEAGSGTHALLTKASATPREDDHAGA